MARHDDTTLAKLERLRGAAKTRSRDVRSLARFAANSDCRLATVGFAARVDFDALLSHTRFEVPYGQSPFAFRRGRTFEDRLRGRVPGSKEKTYAPLLSLLHEGLGYEIAGARVEDVRRVAFDPAVRAKRTEELVREIVQRDPKSPNLLDGAVLARSIGGVMAHFEADAVAARFDGPVHVGEVKSFPTVDGQADPDKVGAAVSQVAIYILLLRELVDRLGGDPSLVSEDALLITPRNTGLQPTMTKKPVGRHVDRAARILSSVPRAEEIADDLPDDLGDFGSVADASRAENARLDALHVIADRAGTCYGPACLAGCGLARFCRERSHEAGDPALVGGKLVRLLPGIDSLGRVVELAAGSKAEDSEATVAEQLRRAAAVKARIVSEPPAKTNRKARKKVRG